MSRWNPCVAYKADRIIRIFKPSVSPANYQTISCHNPSAMACIIGPLPWTGTVHLSRRYGLINHAVFKGEKEESLGGVKKKERGLYEERESLSRFRWWSHGDSQHVYSAVIINRLLYALSLSLSLSLSREAIFFSTVTRFSAAIGGGREGEWGGSGRIFQSIQPTRYTCWPRFVRDRTPRYRGHYSS